MSFSVTALVLRLRSGQRASAVRPVAAKGRGLHRVREFPCSRLPMPASTSMSMSTTPSMSMPMSMPRISRVVVQGQAQVHVHATAPVATTRSTSAAVGISAAARGRLFAAFASPCNFFLSAPTPGGLHSLRGRGLTVSSKAAGRVKRTQKQTTQQKQPRKEANIDAKGKKKKGPAVAGAFDVNKIKGPRGRPVMTDQRFAFDEVLQDTFQLGGGSRGGSSTRHSKDILHSAKQKLGFNMKITHTVTEKGQPPYFIATITTTFPDGLLASYGQNHPHVQHRMVEVTNTNTNMEEDDQHNASTTVPTMSNTKTHVTELVCMGAAQSKKRAEMFAAADALALLYEIGIDGRKPPNLSKLTQDRQRKEAQETYKADLARAHMILEILHCSRPTFDVVEGAKRRGDNDKRFKATASCLLRGTRLSATGAEPSIKSEAEGRALIALVNSQQFITIVGEDVLDFYQQLIDASPGHHIATLRVPPLSDDLLEDVKGCLGSAIDHEIRVQKHNINREAYESKMHERNAKIATSTEGSRQAHSRHLNVLTNEEKERINHALQREEEGRSRKALEHPNGREAAMKTVRDALPIKKIQHDLIEALRSHQVVVVSGGTGSGKSTQCPQYILEDAIATGRGAETQILVTQPRRIAAVSVAERVAAERSENIGKAIGYTVRFNRQSPREYGASIEFVTTGVLLRRLINDPTLAGVSTVMIDEVHERDINTDFLLVLLRDLLKERPDLRVVLMSATLDAESFSAYFSVGNDEAPGVPLLSVPTEPRHPVEVFYLEDLKNSRAGAFPSVTTELAAELLRHNDEQLRIDLEEAVEEESAADELQARSLAEDEGENMEYNSEFDDEESLSDSGSGLSASRVDTLKKAVSLREGDSGQVDLFGRGNRESNKFDSRATIVELTTKIAQQLCREELEAGRSGSILCFLPGWEEIKAATQELEMSERGLKNCMTILPLHSTIPHEDQQKVFEPADGKIKVILATNIAESSVTIDDVLAIVDSGLVRELNFDAESAMTAMETNKTSRASATQRLGRAGRVAPGKCYRLYSRGDFEAMPPRPTPEIQRTALESTCLQTCSMPTNIGVEEFLKQALDPPPEESVAFAMERLVKLGAINVVGDKQALSPLGRLLSRLPLDPATGRMLMMGVVMKCLDPVLTSAACFSSRSVFYNPPGQRDHAQEIRKAFSKSSDIMAMVKAYDEFWSIVDNKGWPQAKTWAFDRYISISAMVSIKAVRSQLLEELKNTGMLAKTDLEGRMRKQTLRFDAGVNENADNEKLYSAIWATAFPGNLAARRPLGPFGTLRTRMDDHAGLHPSSVAFHRKPPRERGVLTFWYLYREMVLSSQVFLRDSTCMDPEQVLLFGGYCLEPVDDVDAKMASRVRGVMDDWILVEGSCIESVDLLCRARSVINLALEHKVMFPNASLPDDSQDILDAVCDILDRESLPKKVDSRIHW